MADAVYFNLTEAAILDSAEVADGIVVDHDAEGRIVEVEIREASKGQQSSGIEGAEFRAA